MQPFKVQHAETTAEEIADAFNLIPLKEANYHHVDPQEVASMQTHLTTTQQQQLTTLLSQFTSLFSGKLGHYKGHKGSTLT